MFKRKNKLVTNTKGNASKVNKFWFSGFKTQAQETLDSDDDDSIVSVPISTVDILEELDSAESIGQRVEPISAWSSQPVQQLDQLDELSTDFHVHIADQSLLVPHSRKQSSSSELSSLINFQTQFQNQSISLSALPARRLHHDSDRIEMNDMFFPVLSKPVNTQTIDKALLPPIGSLEYGRSLRDDLEVDDSFVTSSSVHDLKDLQSSPLMERSSLISNPFREKNSFNSLKFNSPQKLGFSQSLSDQQAKDLQLDALHHHYKTIFDETDNENKAYISTLQSQLESLNSQVLFLEQDSSKLHSICLEYEQRELNSHATLEAMAIDIDRLKAAYQESRVNEKASVQENAVLIQKVQEYSNDFQIVSSRFESAKKLNESQESDFEMFGRKIKSLQSVIRELEEEKSRLKSQLRKAQFDPSTEPAQVLLQSQLDQALYDVEALKHLAQELKGENERLVESRFPVVNSKTSPIRLASLNSPKWATTSDSVVGNGGKWTLPSEAERSRFLQKIKLYEDDASNKSPSTSPSRTLSRQEQQQQSRDSYYERKKSLESQLSLLVDEKKRLVFELSRVPSFGVKSLSRQNELDEQLDHVDSQMAGLRLRLTTFNQQ